MYVSLRPESKKAMLKKNKIKKRTKRLAKLFLEEKNIWWIYVFEIPRLWNKRANKKLIRRIRPRSVLTKFKIQTNPQSAHNHGNGGGGYDRSFFFSARPRTTDFRSGYLPFLIVCLLSTTTLRPLSKPEKPYPLHRLRSTVR